MDVKYCPRCPFFSRQLTRVISHIGLVHSAEANFNVFCGIGGCVNTYTNFTSYRSHLYCCHRYLLEESGSTLGQRRTEDRVEPELLDDEPLLHEEDQMDTVDCGSHPQNQQPSANVRSTQQTAAQHEFSSFLDKAKSTLCNFFFFVTEEHSLPHAAAEKVFAELQLVFELVLKAYGKEVAHAAKTSTTELQQLLNCSFMSGLFSDIKNKYKREQYVQEHFPFTPPEEQVLDSMAKYHYVRLPKLLTALCQIPDIAAHLTTPKCESSTPSTYRHYTDGAVYREHLHHVIPANSTHTILLLFYTDEIEVVNPLGAKRGKHKLLAVYCSLLNLHVKHRSRLQNIYLDSACSVRSREDAWTSAKCCNPCWKT
ncbi:hypothetical protein MTO96_043738 [Rhipicephalus appendiculatus]